MKRYTAMRYGHIAQDLGDAIRSIFITVRQKDREIWSDVVHAANRQDEQSIEDMMDKLEADQGEQNR